MLLRGLKEARAVQMKHVTTPERFFGFRLGSDRELAGWDRMVEYFYALNEQSERVGVREIGRSTEDNPFILCAISSARNMERLERLREVQQSLADPRSVGDGAAETLIGEARAVAAITCSIHATEVGATQMAPELAHKLATADDDQTRAILDNVVVLLIPSLNPDGLIRVKDWYDASLNTHFEGSIPPYLYHKYAGHDNNRDWFMFTQRETRLVVEHVHNAWRPHITYDLHQTRTDGMRMILPPLVDPIGPNVDPVLQSGLSALGTHMAARLTAEGKGGVAVNVVYDSYSPSRSYPHYHGGARALSEAASARIASPIDAPAEALRDGRGERPRTASWNHPMPWKGGKWTLRDIVEYDLSASLACLDHAAKNREWWVRSCRDALKRAAEREGEPFGYVIPKRQHDASAAAELVDILRFADVEVREAAEDDVGAAVSEGDAIIPIRQRYGAFAQTMLERRGYPDMRQYPGGPPKRPYDATAHSLPLKMGVEGRELKSAPSVRTRALGGYWEGGGDSAGRDSAAALAEDAPAYAVSPCSNAAARVVNRLLFAGHPVFRARAALEAEPGGMPAGTWVVSASAESRAALAKGARGVSVAPLRERPRESLRLVKPPRIGVYASYVPCIEEGWTRFVFDDYGFRYVSLADGDIRGGGLNERVDCVIVPHQSVRQIHRGFSRARYSPRFAGGMGDRGVESLREFAERGGTIICWDDSARFVTRHLGLAVNNPLARLSHSEFFAPGSLLNIEVDAEHPIGYGMPKRAAALFMNGPAYEAGEGEAVARFSEDETLLSGWLIGAERIAGLAALAAVPIGLGKVVAFGFRPHFRAQARGTYKMLFNAVYGAGG